MLGPLLDLALGSILGHNPQIVPLLDEYGITVAEVRGAFARDAVCTDAMLTDWADGKGHPWTSFDKDSNVPIYARSFIDWRREARMLRVSRGERLASCTDQGDLPIFMGCITYAPDRQLKSGAVHSWKHQRSVVALVR